MMRKHTVYSLICVILAMAMTAVCLVGCFGQSEYTGETVGGTSTDSSDFAGSSLTVVENGQSDYSIYYASSLSSDDAFVSVIGAMSKMIKNGTGVLLQMSTDRYYSDVLADEPAILVGVTQWAESQQIAETLEKMNDYYIGIVGNKVVICGKSAEACTTAVQYFMNNIMSAQMKAGSTLTVSSAHTVHQRVKYGIGSVKILGTELCEYDMVIPKNADVNEHFFAYSLRYWLMNNYGVLLNISDDSGTAGEHEILIGNTSRSSSPPGKNEYSVKASDGKLELSANGFAAYDELYDYVTKTLIPSGGNKDYTVSERSDTVDATEGFERRTESTLASTGDIRTMFYNMYGWESYSESVRMRMQLEMLEAYSPDVIGFQEFSSNVRSGSLISKLTELGYSEVRVNGVSSNFTPLFYRSDKLEIVDSGYLLYEGLNDVNSKSVTWAVMRVRATGKCFIAMSTHFYWTSDLEGDAARLSEAGQLLELIGTIRSNASYAELPLIVGGDLNCTVSSAPADILRGGGLVSAWDEAALKNDSSGHHKDAEYSTLYETYISWSRPTKKYADSIDQVWKYGNITVNGFVTVTCTYALIASDHCPEIVDISF